MADLQGNASSLQRSSKSIPVWSCDANMVILYWIIGCRIANYDPVACFCCIHIFNMRKYKWSQARLAIWHICWSCTITLPELSAAAVNPLIMMGTGSQFAILWPDYAEYVCTSQCVWAQMRSAAVCYSAQLSAVMSPNKAASHRTRHLG